MINVWKYIPYKLHRAVNEAWHDSDGYWVTLNRGWHDGIMDCHVIHTDTIAELKEELKLIHQVEE